MTNQERLVQYGPNALNQKIVGAGDRTRPMLFLPSVPGKRVQSFRYPGRMQEQHAPVSAETRKPSRRQQIRLSAIAAHGLRRLRKSA